MTRELPEERQNIRSRGGSPQEQRKRICAFARQLKTHRLSRPRLQHAAKATYYYYYYYYCYYDDYGYDYDYDYGYDYDDYYYYYDYYYY